MHVRRCVFHHSKHNWKDSIHSCLFVFAHKGCFLAVDNTGNIIDKSQLEEKEDYYEKNLFHLKPGDNMTPGILKTLRQNTDKVLGVFVYGQQGKSKHTQASTISELLASNAQLVELGPDRATDDYVVPEGGLQQGLCGQIVRITDPDVWSDECSTVTSPVWHAWEGLHDEVCAKTTLL